MDVLENGFVFPNTEFVATPELRPGDEPGVRFEAPELTERLATRRPRKRRTAFLHSIELDRRIAIGLVLDAARPGDVVVLAGKGHETTQTIGDDVRPFDDRVVARELLAARGWSS